MLTSVIYRNESRSTILLDLPASIENGQYLLCNEPVQSVPHLLSRGPPEQPFPCIEPKGLKRAKLLENIPQPEQEYHQTIQSLILDSLHEIRSALEKRIWLFPRQNLVSALKEYQQLSPGATADEPAADCPVILSCISNVFPSLSDIAGRIVSNPFCVCTSLIIDGHVYHVPPRSAFILSDVRRLRPLTEAFSSNVLLGSFDFVLADPPWQNRSARHAKAYKISDDRNEDRFVSVLSILQGHLRSDGLVGIWVTNKASIRRLVLESLQRIGFRLYEEWVWMKTTVSGDPVTPLDGVWRRPYEVLLLFRKEESHQCGTAGASEPAHSSIWATGVPCRIFVAVPNHHSQKPCLKEFIEPLLVDPTNYRALEIFARNLTAGWFSCGNEVLKVNHKDNWAAVNG